MKKIILVVLVCLCFNVLASAQTGFAPTFQAGIKGGADYSLYPAYQGYTNKGEFGYIGGFWANMTIFNFLNFQPEIYATEKTSQVTDQQGGTGILYIEKSHLTTVDIPLLVGGKFGTNNVSVRVYAGPVISFAVSKVQSFTDDNFYAERFNYKDQYISWQLGAGLNINKLTFDVRYEAGLSKVGYGGAVNPVTNAQTSSTHLNVVSFTIGYTLFSSFGNDTY